MMTQDAQNTYVQQELALETPKQPRRSPEDQLALHLARGNAVLARRLKNTPLFRVALHGRPVVFSTPLLPGRTGWGWQQAIGRRGG